MNVFLCLLLVFGGRRGYAEVIDVQLFRLFSRFRGQCAQRRSRGLCRYDNPSHDSQGLHRMRFVESTVNFVLPASPQRNKNAAHTMKQVCSGIGKKPVCLCAESKCPRCTCFFFCFGWDRMMCVWYSPLARNVGLNVRKRCELSRRLAVVFIDYRRQCESKMRCR